MEAEHESAQDVVRKSRRTQRSNDNAHVPAHPMLTLQQQAGNHANYLHRVLLYSNLARRIREPVDSPPEGERKLSAASGWSRIAHRFK